VENIWRPAVAIAYRYKTQSTVITGNYLYAIN